jgi:hypothetical protein
MDSNGYIHDLEAEGLSEQDAARQGMVAIPPVLLERVVYLSRPQRREWRRLVQSGTPPEEALLRVQLAP